MDKLKLELDRDYIKKEVSKHVDRFFDDFKKAVGKLDEQKKLIKELKYSKTMLVRAYCVKLGIYTMLAREYCVKLGIYIRPKIKIK